MSIRFATRVESWDLLNAALKPRVAEMPELLAEQQEIESVIAQARGLQAEQELLRARLREVIRLRQEAESRGHELRGRIASLLRGKLGFTSEQLIAYGLAPRRKARRKKDDAGPEVPAPAPPSASPQSKAPAVEAPPASGNRNE